jgi:hypothetical protein
VKGPEEAKVEAEVADQEWDTVIAEVLRKAGVKAERETS